MSAPGVAKRVETTNQTRNIYGVRPDRLICCLPLTDNSTGEPTDLGVGDTYNDSMQDFSGALGGDPELVESDSTEADADTEGPYIKCNSDAGNDGYVEVHTASGDLEFTNSTILIRFRDDEESTSTKILADSGVFSGTDQYVLRIVTTGGGTDTSGRYKTVRLITHDGTLRTVDVDEVYTNTGDGTGGEPLWITLIVRLSAARGQKVWVQSGTSAPQTADNAAYTHSWKIEDGNTLRLAAFQTGTQSGEWALNIFSLWDIALEDEEIMDLLMDPFLPIRPLPDVTTYFKNPAPLIGRTTTTTSALWATTGVGDSGGEVASAALNIRARTIDESTWAAGSYFTGTAIDDVEDTNTTIPCAVTGLTAATRYKLVSFWTSDGSSWTPFCAGPLRLTTQRSAMPEGGFAIAIGSDRHDWTRGAPDDAGIAVRRGTGGDEAAYCEWAVGHDLLYRIRRTRTDIPQVDFIVNLGDDAGSQNNLEHSTDDINQQVHENYVDHLTRNAHWYRAGDSTWVVGNHDGMCGWLQNGDSSGLPAALQKQATIAFKRHYPNPTHETYSEGGENEGDVGAVGTEVGVTGDGPYPVRFLDWLPRFDDDRISDYTAYLDTYVRDANAENSTPLQNYFAKTWGDVLFVYLDAYRYTDPANADAALNATASTFRSDLTDYWSFGDTQTAWAENVLATSTATWKVIFLHPIPGNGYGRGNVIGDHEGGPQGWLRSIARRYGAIIMHGHDHTFCHSYASGVNYIECPTTTFKLAVNEFYGLPETEGADLYEVGDGLGTAAGIVKRIHITGYVIMHFESDKITVYMRRAHLARDPSGQTDFDIDSEHYLGPLATIETGDVVTLTEPPADVGFIISQEDIDSNSEWYDSPTWQDANDIGPGDTGTGDYYEYEDYGTTTELDVTPETGDTQVRLHVAPYNVYSAEMTPSAQSRGKAGRNRRQRYRRY